MDPISMHMAVRDAYLRARCGVGGVRSTPEDRQPEVPGVRDNAQYTDAFDRPLDTGKYFRVGLAK